MFSDIGEKVWPMGQRILVQITTLILAIQVWADKYFRVEPQFPHL